MTEQAQEPSGLTAETLERYRQAAALDREGMNARRRVVMLLANDPATRLEAELIYERLSHITPNDFALAIERADNLARLNDSVKAILLYRRAFEINPESEVALSGYLREIAKIGATSVAIEQTAKLLEGKPENLAARLQLAELLRDEGHFKDALNQYFLAKRLSPRNAIALRGAAEAWLAQGYVAYAEEAFDELVKQSNQPISRDDRARLLIAENRLSAALKLLLANSSHPADKRELNAFLTLADLQYGLNDLTGARMTLNQLLALIPVGESPDKRIAALERLARVSYKLNDPTATRAACERLLSLEENNTIALLGLQIIKEPDSSSSIKIRTPVDSASESSEEARARRRAAFDRATGEAALFWNKPEVAKTYLQRAAAILTRSPRISLTLAATFQALNDLDAASAAYASVDAKGGRNLRALFGQAAVEVKRGNNAAALALYRFVLRLDATNLHALAGEAAAIERDGNFGEAAALYAELLKRAPEVAEFREGLVKGLAELGRSGYATASAGSSPAVLFASGDKLRVQVSGKLRFDGEAEINYAGYMSLPFLTRTLNAVCLDTAQLQNEIAKFSRLPINSSDVKISIVKYGRAPLSVAGAVYIPNIFYVRKKLNLRQSLMLASGTTQNAGNIVYVVRNVGGILCRAEESLAAAPKRVETYFQINEKSDGTVNNQTAMSDNFAGAPVLQAGDLVFVPDREAVFIYGAVARPQIVKARSGLTLLELVRTAGGTLDKAKRGQVKLIRLQRQGATSQKFAVNLDDIEQNRLGDVILLPGDMVEIPFSDTSSANASLARILRQAASGAMPFLRTNNASGAVKAAAMQ
ncbi:MAG: SLBB domain-containing protein [Pyrinomonadaceae bacterium MAG19_C2-C3]|nr:SLBB domain-containing protein [Pyrinomonadaceae bacterium MAG19_C2-C3]